MVEDSKTVIKKGKATELTQKVAEILMELRQKRDASQRHFAEILGVSFQQYQKYEKGKDRLSLEKAMVLCASLGLSLDIFSNSLSQYTGGFGESEQAAFSSRPEPSPEEGELLVLYHKVPKKARQDFLETMRGMAKMAASK